MKSNILKSSVILFATFLTINKSSVAKEIPFTPQSFNPIPYQQEVVSGATILEDILCPLNFDQHPLVSLESSINQCLHKNWISKTSEQTADKSRNISSIN